MSSERDMPRTPDELRTFMDGLTFGTPSREQEAELLGSLPPAGSEVMVVRSLRLPQNMDARIKAVAQARGVPASTLIREWCELELTSLEHDQPISRADALRALASLRPLGGNSAA